MKHDALLSFLAFASKNLCGTSRRLRVVLRVERRGDLVLLGLRLARVGFDKRFGGLVLGGGPRCGSRLSIILVLILVLVPVLISVFVPVLFFGLGGPLARVVLLRLRLARGGPGGQPAELAISVLGRLLGRLLLRLSRLGLDERVAGLALVRRAPRHGCRRADGPPRHRRVGAGQHAHVAALPGSTHLPVSQDCGQGQGEEGGNLCDLHVDERGVWMKYGYQSQNACKKARPACKRLKGEKKSPRMKPGFCADAG